MTEKITGYSLIVVGLVFILFACFSVYQVFKGQAKPYPLFNFKGISLDLTSMLSTPSNLPPEAQAMVELQKASVKPTELISGEMLNDTSNIAAHIFLMGFVASIGMRISTIGTQLTRTIQVKLKESAPQQQPQVAK